LSLANVLPAFSKVEKKETKTSSNLL
jgi:hypothetical protein